MVLVPAVVPRSVTAPLQAAGRMGRSLLPSLVVELGANSPFPRPRVAYASAPCAAGAFFIFIF